MVLHARGAWLRRLDVHLALGWEVIHVANVGSRGGKEAAPVPTDV